MRARYPVLRKYMRVLSSEEERRTWLAEVWQPLVLLVWGLAAWNLSQGLAPYVPPAPEIDYASFFHGRAEHLGKRLVRLYYDFEPADDPLNRYPQLQDWNCQRGVLKGEGWLVGNASLNVAFEDLVDLSFRFKLHRGRGLMPALGVRGSGSALTFIAVLLERDGKVSVWKYLAGMPQKLHETSAEFHLEPDEEHRLEISVREIKGLVDASAVNPARKPMEPEAYPEIMDIPQMPGDGAQQPPASGGSQAVAASEATALIEAPCLRLNVRLDGAKILSYIVEGYELKGWMSLMAWNSVALYDEVTIVGRLHPAWIIKEWQTRQILSAPETTE